MISKELIMSDKQGATLRSNFLVHWTGRDIQTDYKAIRKCELQSDLYVNRLVKTLNEGLWMTVNEEIIKGAGDIQIEYNKEPFPKVPMTSFTEIKLSEVEKHTQSYGCLGFGFSRNFVIELGGTPVQYVSSDEHDNITAHFFRQLKELEALENALLWLDSHSNANDTKREYKEGWDRYWGLLLSKAMNNLGLANTHTGIQDIIAHLIKCQKKDDDIFKGLMRSISNNVLFVKRMWKNEPGDFMNLDESEWRIVYGGQKNITDDKNEDHVHKIKFEPENLKVLILPDEITRQKALPHIQKWLSGLHLPIIAIIEECLQF